MNEFVCDFPIGNLNQKYKKYFDGDSWIARLSEENTQVIIDNVTFAPGSRNHWHIHHGVQQILVCVGLHISHSFQKMNCRMEVQNG